MTEPTKSVDVVQCDRDAAREFLGDAVGVSTRRYALMRAASSRASSACVIGVIRMGGD